MKVGKVRLSNKVQILVEAVMYHKPGMGGTVEAKWPYVRMGRRLSKDRDFETLCSLDIEDAEDLVELLQEAIEEAKEMKG